MIKKKKKTNDESDNYFYLKGAGEVKQATRSLEFVLGKRVHP